MPGSCKQELLSTTAAWCCSMCVHAPPCSYPGVEMGSLPQRFREPKAACSVPGSLWLLRLAPPNIAGAASARAEPLPTSAGGAGAARPSGEVQAPCRFDPDRLSSRRFPPQRQHGHTWLYGWEAVPTPAQFAWQQQEMDTVRDGARSPRASVMSFDSGRMGYGEKPATGQRPHRLSLAGVACHMYKQHDGLLVSTVMPRSVHCLALIRLA